jgi:hypothetical protein
MYGYAWASAAAILASADNVPAAVASWHCGVNGVAWFDTRRKGIAYTLDAERGPDWSSQHHAHLIRWGDIERHCCAQPSAIRAALIDARRLDIEEERRHWDNSHAINPNGYCTKVPEQRAALDAEWKRHMAAYRRLHDDVKRTVAAMLPLRDLADEPQDLIEWAAALA